ncbi:30S ribosomal protein S17 [Patescibacteria group bacterium]|nr:30S ribosomal protein S17 [Patescibacteria group bacterium]
MPKRKLTGKVVSDKMQKTVVVEVQRLKQHAKYRRFLRIHKKYKADDAREEYKVGDRVVIEESRPLSKDKKWKVISKAS